MGKVSGWVGMAAGVAVAGAATLVGNWGAVIVWLGDNEKLAGWAQFAGAVIALGVAIAVPAWQEAARARAEERELRLRRQAAYNAVRAVTEVVANKQQVYGGELNGVMAVVDALDPRDFTPLAMEHFVGIRNRLARAVAGIEHEVRAQPGRLVPVQFNATAARVSVRLFRDALGAD